MTSTRLSTRTRRAAVAVTAAVLLGGVSACAGEGDVPDDLTQEVEGLSQDLGTLDERITELEDQVAEVVPAEPSPEPVDQLAVFADPSQAVGDVVTVAGDVGEIDETTDAGVAFMVTGPSGNPLPVVTTDAPEELTADGAVLLYGPVLELDEATFEEDFGVALEDLFVDPETFLEDTAGQPVLNAETVELEPNPSGD